jgi:signal transduction protein with GAF and PtsI domain
MTTDFEAPLRAAIAALHAESGTVHLLDASGELKLRASVGIPESVLDHVREVPVGKGMAGLAAQRNEPVTACNIQTDVSGDVRPGAKATGMEGAIVVPIHADGRVIGALGVANRAARTFSAAETAQLQRLADDIGARARA